MVAVPGRSADARTVGGVVTTTSSTAITGPAGSFDAPEDVGRSIAGTGIPAGTTISAVASSSAATLSAAATASGTITASLGAGSPATYGFYGWSPLADTEQGAYTVAAVNAGTVAADRITDTATRVQQRSRG
jgi:hypothetical protein